MKDRLRDSAGIPDQKVWKIDRFGIYISVVQVYSLWPVWARSSSIKYDWATNIEMTPVKMKFGNVHIEVVC